MIDVIWTAETRCHDFQIFCGGLRDRTKIVHDLPPESVAQIASNH